MTQSIAIAANATPPSAIVMFENGDPANTATGTTIGESIADAFGYLLNLPSRYLEGPDSTPYTVDTDLYSRVKIPAATGAVVYTIGDPLGTNRSVRVYTRNNYGGGNTVEFRRADTTSMAQFDGTGVAWVEFERYDEGSGVQWYVTAWGGDITVVLDP